MAKTTEIVIYDSRRKQQHMPPPLPGIARVDSLRVLGVTLTRRLSASDHIRQVVGDCSQSLYALRVLRHYGLTDVCLQHGAGSSQRLIDIASTRSSAAANAVTTVTQIFPTFNELLEECDDRLFHKLCSNTGH